MSFTFNYLCVRIQREQLQSRLVPHPRLDVSSALRRGERYFLNSNHKLSGA